MPALDIPPNATLVESVRLFQNTGWHQRQAWALSCAVLWTALEMVLSRALTGFPWNLLGSSQYQMLPLIQLAAWTGVYGLSFLMVWLSVTLASAAVVLLRQPAIPRMALSEVLFPMTTLLLVLTAGVVRLRENPQAARHLKLAMIQPSIPQTLIWNPNEDTNRFQKLLQLSQIALQTQPDLLVWPEAAIPNLLRYDPMVYSAVTNLAASNRVWMIVGADDAEPRQTNPGSDEADYYNASFLVDPSGRLAARYCKRRLVVFGEYLPLQPWLFFLKWFTPVRTGFTPGREPVTFVLDSPRARIAPLICFEDVFPQLARESVDDETDVLLNLTNNGWFGESAAQWQHAANAVFRAVENGLPLARCANNGLTCWVDDRGRLDGIPFEDTRDVYGAGFKSFQIPLSSLENRGTTFYRRHGDWLGWGCVAGCGLLWFRARIRQKPSAPLTVKTQDP
jgi:apolipoprotein N-acyltransferase